MEFGCGGVWENLLSPFSSIHLRVSCGIYSNLSDQGFIMINSIFTRLSILLVAAVAASVAGAKLVLVENGQPRVPIIIFEDAPPYTLRSAHELAEYIEKVTGGKPQVIEGTPDPLPEHAIWVGYQPVMDSLFPAVDFDFEHPEEILITANERHLAIVGRDRWDPDNLVVPGRRAMIHGMQQEYGTANAVYTFLRDYLGVRWLWPGELGEDIIEQPTLAFESFVYTYYPQIRHRDGVLYLSALGGRAGQSHDWSRMQRLQLGSLNLAPSSHGFTSWWERFGESNPEYFALQPNGERNGWPGPRTVKICQSNPDVWQQWVDDVETALKENPNLTSIDAGPNDGWSSGHCICPDCLAWDHPEGEPRQHHWQGMIHEYRALSDRDVKFYNELARLIRERYPDREFYVRGSAYGHTRPAPIEAIPDDNVIITSVANFLFWPDAVDRGSTWGTTHRQQFADWGKVAPNLGWRPNASGWWRNGFPDTQMQQTMEDWRFVAENNTISITIDTPSEFWSTQGPIYYLIGNLTWDPYQDPHALMEDYYSRAFGKAAGTMTEYWERMEAASIIAQGGRGDPSAFDEEFFTTAYSLLDTAKAEVAGEREKYGQRIEFVRAGLDYARLYLELLVVIEKHNATQDPDAAERAREIWAEFERIGTDYPYAIYWEHIRPQRSIMQRWHPDWPQ